jgi:ribosome-interacting GTPase 1
MKITFQTPPKNLDEKMLYNILRDYKMLNCEVLVRDENGMATPIYVNRSVSVFVAQISFYLATVDDFIDVIMKDHRKYIRW